MILLEKVSKSFKRRHGVSRIFTDLDLAFTDGSRTAIMGLTGTGKSTLINMMTGMLRPDSGRVYRSGVISYPMNALGVISAAMTVRQNINFLCRVYGFDEEPVQAFVESYTRLPRLMNEFVGNLTQNERVQFGYTIGYALPFETYLIDNVYAAGPVAVRERIARLLNARLESAGLVFATKSIPTARLFCNRAVVLDGGRPHVYENLEDGARHFADLVRSEQAQPVR